MFRVSSDKNKTTQHGPCVEDADMSKCERLALSQQLNPYFKLSHVRFLGPWKKLKLRGFGTDSILNFAK